MASILWFWLLSTAIAAVPYGNQSTSVVTDTVRQQYDSSLSANGFVDCSSYSAALTTGLPANATKTGSSLPASSQSVSPALIPFEEYWCAHWAHQNANTPDSYPNNGSLVPYLYGLNASARAFCLSLEKANYSSWATKTPPTMTIGTFVEPIFWKPTLTPPCCDTFCNIYASSAQLLYWPTPAPVPAATTVVEDGFTFTSPSVYIVYKGVSAAGQCGQVGPTYSSLTQSYLASDISSFPPGQFGEASSLDFRQLWSNCTSRAATYTHSEGPVAACLTQTHQRFSSGIPPYCQSQLDQISSSYFADQIHCFPHLSFPTGLQDVNPAWSPCDTNNYGGHFAYVFDPPRRLGLAANLGPVPTEDPGLPASATPAASLPPAVPQKTAPPSVPPVVSASANDPPAANTANRGPPKDPTTTDPQQPSQGPSTKPADPLRASSAVPALGGQSLSGQVINPNSNLLVGSTIKGGTSAVQVQGQPVSVDPAASNVIIDGQAHTLSPLNSPFAPLANNNPAAAAFSTTIQGHVIQAASSPDVVVVDGQSIARGGDSISLTGTPIALHTNGDLILGSSTVQNVLPIPTPTLVLPNPAPVITAAGQPATVVPNGVAIAGTILSSNAPAITVSGTPIALGTNGLVVGTSTVPLPVFAQAPVITAAGQPFTVVSNGVVIASTTLSPNAPAITISGTPISLGNSDLIVGTSTVPLPPLTPAPIITAAGQPATILSNGIVIAGTTLHLNAPAITIAGTPISLGSNGLIVGSSTIVLPSQPLISSITLAGQAVPISQATNGFVVAGTTLQVGQPAITISGTPVALGSSGLVVGTSTIPFQTVTGSSPTQGLGALVLSGLNGGPAATTATGSVGSGQTPPSNSTGAAGGTAVSTGGGGRVGIRWGASVGMGLYLFLVAV